MSLCFKDAYRERRINSITEEAYLGHLLAHFCGVRHVEDNRNAFSAPSPDPFGASIQDMVLETDCPTLQGKRHSLLIRWLH
jgi:hypothetical protein